jgi:NADH-quinone oxidoreductase subunit M
MLRMLQRVIWGGTSNPDHSKLWDLNWRETITLAPLLAFVFWIGLYPEPFLRVIRASLGNLLLQTGCAVP